MTEKLSPDEPQADVTAVVKRNKIVETRHIDGVTYSFEWTRCGHANRCQKCKAAYYGHGPYWFARYHDPKAGERGKTVGVYIGKVFKTVERAF